VCKKKCSDASTRTVASTADIQNKFAGPWQPQITAHFAAAHVGDLVELSPMLVYSRRQYHTPPGWVRAHVALHTRPPAPMLTQCASVQLKADVTYFARELHDREAVDSTVDIVDLACSLASLGHEVKVRYAEGGGPNCFRNLFHEFLLVKVCFLVCLVERVTWSARSSLRRPIAANRLAFKLACREKRIAQGPKSSWNVDFQITSSFRAPLQRTAVYSSFCQQCSWAPSTRCPH
jgi:hypothetical protein